MIREHSKQLEESNSPPAFYFFDIFVLNQHEMTKDCTEDEGRREELTSGLKKSICTCGRVLLCCSSGPSQKPGWEEPAPISRIWCTCKIEKLLLDSAARLTTSAFLPPRSV